jgi:hypothetical protein
MFFLTYLACGFYLWLLGMAVSGEGFARRSLFHAPWLGYAGLIACLQVIHLFAPLDALVSWSFLAISCLGAAGVVLVKLRRRPRETKEAERLSLPAQLGFLLAIAWLFFLPAFNTTTQPIVHYDVGYYYLQTIRWTTTFPIVPGLGNLFLNLAFNQSPFLVASLFNSLGPHLWGYSLLGGVLPWMGLTLSGFALLQGLGALAGMRRPLEPIEKAYLISMPAWVYTLLTPNISSNSPDINSACLQIHLFLCFASFLAADGDRALRREFSTLLVLIALSLSVKLNSLFYVATIGAISIVVVMTRSGPLLLRSRQVLWASLISAAILLPWVVRGYIVSGYPLFPSNVLGAPVVWRVPEETVSHFYDIITYWGRQPYYELEKVKDTFAWVPEWWQRKWKMQDQFVRPLTLCGAWALLLGVLAWRLKELRPSLVRLSLITLPVLVSLLTWFFTAPDPRYLGSMTWLLPLAAPLAIIGKSTLLSAALIVLAFSINHATLGNLRYNTEWAWKKRAPGFPEIRQVEILEGDNPQGVFLRYPKEGDRPFDAPLPSAQAMHPTLDFLDKRKGMSGGFRDVRTSGEPERNAPENVTNDDRCEHRLQPEAQRID